MQTEGYDFDKEFSQVFVFIVHVEQSLCEQKKYVHVKLRCE
jgi:hypothetical protein